MCVNRRNQWPAEVAKGGSDFSEAYKHVALVARH